MTKNSGRLQSLDVVRGLTVAAMIMVNNGYRDSFEMLRHADWNGLSVSDFVFPFFLFIMGVSLFLSFQKTGFRFSSQLGWKIVKRTLLLLIIGIAINWFDMVCSGKPLDFAEIRFWAVLQRIALCYFAASFIVLLVNHRLILPLSFALLVIYAFIIVTGNGYAQDKGINILYLTDYRIFGDNHLYHKSAVDPEGLISTMSALTNVLFGFYVGMRMKTGNPGFSQNGKGMPDKSLNCFVTGILLLITGFIVNFFLPANKHIWSPSFALITSGVCSLFLGLFIKWVDIDKMSNPVIGFLKVFGCNALLLYITSEIMAILFGCVGISEKIFQFFTFLLPIAPLASLCYALTYVALNFLIGYPLYRRHIYIRL